MRRFIPCIFVLLLCTSMGLAQTGILLKLNELEALTNQLPADDRQKFVDYIEMVRETLDDAHFSATGHLLDVMLVQLVSMVLDGTLPLSDSSPLEDPDEPLIAKFVRKIDEIKSQELFFKADKADLEFLRSETFYFGSMDCSVRIFARGIGPVMFDTGGVLYLLFGETAELLAVGGESFGGKFDWEWEEGNNNEFYSKGDRAYFRVGAYETASVRVTHTTDFGMQCQAVLRVIMQDGFPVFDEDEF